MLICPRCRRTTVFEPEDPEVKLDEHLCMDCIFDDEEGDLD